MDIYKELNDKLSSKYDLTGLAKVILAVKALDEVIPFYYRDEFVNNGLKDINSLLEGDLYHGFEVYNDYDFSDYEMDSLSLDDFNNDNTVDKICDTLLSYIVSNAVDYAEYMDPNNTDYNSYYDIEDEYDTYDEADTAAQSLLRDIENLDITKKLKGVTDPIEVVRIIDNNFLEFDSDNVYDIEDAIIKSGVSFK